MPPHYKPARGVHPRTKRGVSNREFERLLERAEKYLTSRDKRLVRAARPARGKSISSAA
jgi:hypothetical protein